jgi:hypothetical protein
MDLFGSAMAEAGDGSDPFSGAASIDKPYLEAGLT